MALTIRLTNIIQLYIIVNQRQLEREADMLSQRIRQLRLARSWTLEGLSAEMGGIVTKQALQKYEQGKTKPSPVVMNKLAAALGVKAAHLWAEPDVRVEFIAFRKGARLPKREEERVTSLVSHTLEERVRLQRITQPANGAILPIKSLRVNTLDDAEMASEEIRRRWNLGTAPISSVIGVLEDHEIQVIQINADEKFDGMAAVAYDEDKQKVAAAVVTRYGVPGERQRTNLTHELGHLVLKVSSELDEEKAAFRFGTALLAPASMLRHEVGEKRAFIQTEELGLIKQRFGISLQALLHRLNDLDIITDSYYRQWCIHINRLGWRKREPFEMQPEQPQWLHRNVLRALAEDLISPDEAKGFLDEPVESQQALSLVQRRAFLKLPLEKRRQMMAEQARNMEAHYRHESDWRSWEAGDLVES